MSRAIISLPCLLLLVASSCGTEPEEQRPDVLLLVIDTLRADHLSCYGYDRPTSPVIDALAERGALFTRASAQAPWTLPSMSSMWTSRYFTAHRDFPEDGAPTLAQSFQAGGYHTIGVVGNPLLESNLGFGWGFDEYELLPENSDNTFPDLLELLRAPLDLAVAAEDRAPLFLYVHAFDPHAPYVAHPEYDDVLPPGGAPKILPAGWQEEVLERYGPTPPEEDPGWGKALRSLHRERGRYDQEIRFADTNVGTLLEMLEQRGISDSLLIVLVSDHGEGLYEHVTPASIDKLKVSRPKNLFFGGHGYDLSEQALRTPFLLVGPGVPPGSRFGEPVENVDLFPTLLTLCDLPRPGDLHGVDLSALFSGDADPDGWRTESYAYIKWYACVRDEVSQLKLVVPTEITEEKGGRGATLYHLGDDPRERNNLAEELPDEFSRLSDRLEAYLERYPTTIQRVDERISLDRLRALGYAGQGSEDEDD